MRSTTILKGFQGTIRIHAKRDREKIISRYRIVMRGGGSTCCVRKGNTLTADWSCGRGGDLTPFSAAAFDGRLQIWKSRSSRRRGEGRKPSDDV